MPQYTHLVLSGGGLSGVVYIGAFRYLYENGLHDSIKTVSGTSIGALFGLLFVLGVSTEVMERAFSNLSHDLVSIDITDVFSLATKMGMHPGIDLDKLLKSSMDVDVRRMTFKRLSRKYGKSLHVCATNVATMAPTYFSDETTPDVLVIDAIRASMAIPIVFMPVTIDGAPYIDGGIVHCIPLGHCRGNESETLILSLSTKSLTQYQYPMSEHADVGVGIGNLLTYISNIINTHIQNQQAHDVILSKYPHYILITDIPMPPMSFELHDSTVCMTVPQQVRDCIDHGYDVLQKHTMKL